MVECFFVFVFEYFLYLGQPYLSLTLEQSSHISEKWIHSHHTNTVTEENTPCCKMLHHKHQIKSSQSCMLWQQSVFLQWCSVMVKPHNCSQSISAMFMCLKGHTEQTWAGGVERESTSGEKKDPLYQYSISSSHATSHCKLRKLLLPLSIYMFEREHMNLHNWKEMSP